MVNIEEAPLRSTILPPSLNERSPFFVSDTDNKKAF